MKTLSARKPMTWWYVFKHVLFSFAFCNSYTQIRASVIDLFYNFEWGFIRAILYERRTQLLGLDSILWKPKVFPNG